jgi:plasmid stabilization system protein ParE
VRRSRLTAGARRDVATILAWSETRFGKRQRRLYRLLLERAFATLREDPHRPGVRTDPDRPPDLRLYPIRFSRADLPPAERVGRPRHVVAFRLEGDGMVILRVLDEAMDVPDRLG